MLNKRLILIAAFLVVSEGCQPPLETSPIPSSKVPNKVNKTNKVLFAQSVYTPTVATIGNQGDEEVVIRKGSDNCIYYELINRPDKKRVLPLLTNSYATSQQLNEFYTKNIDKTITVETGGILDNLKEEFPEDSIYWLSQAPYKNCQATSEWLFDYSTISKYQVHKITVDKNKHEKQYFIPVVYYPPRLDNDSSDAIKKWGKTIKAKIINRNDCLYLEDENKTKVFPIFRMPKVAVSDDKLIINNNQFNFNEFYNFTLFESINVGEHNLSEYSNFIQKPSPECIGQDFSVLEYVINVK